MRKSLLLLILGCLAGCGPTTQTPSAKPGASTTPAATATLTVTPSPSQDRSRQRLRQHLDTNHDGQVSDGEIEAGFDKALQKGKRLKRRVDTNKDGVISAQERKAGLARFRKRFLRSAPTPEPEANQKPGP